jgi:non-specific serine/threonine protein kinase
VDGTVLADRYLLTDELGSGGMGTVYRATDLRTGGPVAVKVPHPYLARDPVFRERLRREAQLAAALTSPRVVRVVDLDEHEGVPYLVMEYVGGETLAERLRRAGPFPVAEAVAIAVEVSRALEAAHALGIVHRDLAPRNVKLVDGQVKVLDFGIAQAAGMAELTPPGGFAGTPAYSAPERTSGMADGSDPRSDLYSVGAVLYTLLAGHAPTNIPGVGLPPLTDVPPVVEHILARCLDPQPARRYGSAADLTAALNDALGDTAVRGAPRARATGVTPAPTPAISMPPSSTLVFPAPTAPGTATSGAPIAPPGADDPPVPHNLPASLTSFVGREVDVSELVHLVRGPGLPGAGAGGAPHTTVGGAGRARLVTIVGAGGAGKTRLALQVANRLVEPLGRPPGPEQSDPASGRTGWGGTFPDGVWLVSLSSLADGQLIPQAVATALGVRVGPGTTVLDGVAEWLSARRLLLILDNCEHVIDDSAAFVQAVLLAAPGLRIVATSREPLGVPGEVLWRLPTLPVPDLEQLPGLDRLADYAAVRLFVERARAASPAFSLTPGNAAAVARICRRLDGLPLAIELAAARARVLAPEQIAARLDDRFRLLTAGSRTAPPHQQTLRASIDWSYDLLSPAERILFARLSIFAGSLSLEAAEAVCAGDAVAVGDEIDPGDVLDLLSQLVDKSLVVARDDDRGDRQYLQPETVRQYAAARLVERGEEGAVARAHGHYFARLAATAAGTLSGPDQAFWLDNLESEHDNLRAALRWALAQNEVAVALSLVSDLWKFWAIRGYYVEGQRWAADALASAGAELRRDPQGVILLARAHNAAGNLARARRDYATAREQFESSLALWRETGDRRGLATALSGLGNVANDQGDAAAARPLYEESLVLRREENDGAGIALLLTSLGNLAYNRRDFATANECYAESLARHQQAGDKGGIALLHVSLGQVARATADPARAAEQGKAGLALFRELGDRWGTSLALGLLGRLALDGGDFAAASAYLDECSAILRALDDRWNLAIALLSQARAAQFVGDLERAAALCAEGLSLALAGRLVRHVASGLETAAEIVLQRTLWAGAADRDADEGAGEDRDETSEAAAAIEGEDGPEGPQIVVDEAGKAVLARAATLIGAATTLRRQAGSAVLPADRAHYDAVLAAFRRRLGAGPFDLALAAGARLTMDQGAAEATNLLERPVPVRG